MGEVSAGRQALEGAVLGPGNMTALNQLRNPDRHPVQPVRELPGEFREFQPVVPFKLDIDSLRMSGQHAMGLLRAHRA